MLVTPEMLDSKFASLKCSGKFRPLRDWFGRFLLKPVLAEFSRHPRICLELLTNARLYSLPLCKTDLVFR